MKWVIFLTHKRFWVPMSHMSDSLWLSVIDVIYVQYKSWVSYIKYDSLVPKIFCESKIWLISWYKKIRSQFMNMTQLYYAIKLVIWNHIDSNFCVGGSWNFKKIYIILIQIEFAFKWYAYRWYCKSETRDIAGVLKIEHCT